MKKILTLLLAFGLLTSIIFAQDDTNKFHLEFSVQSIGVLYKGLSYAPIAPYPFTYLLDESVLPYAVSASAFWDLNKRFELGIGVGFSNRDAHYKIVCNTCRRPSNFFFEDYPEPKSYLKRRAIEIPAELRFNWFKEYKKIDPFVSVGTIHRLPIKYFLEEGEEKPMLDFTQYSIGLFFSLGTRVQLSEKWSLLTSASILHNQNYILLSDQWVKNDFIELNSAWEWTGRVAVRRTF